MHGVDGVAHGLALGDKDGGFAVRATAEGKVGVSGCFSGVSRDGRVETEGFVRCVSILYIKRVKGERALVEEVLEVSHIFQPLIIWWFISQLIRLGLEFGKDIRSFSQDVEGTC